MSLNLEKEFLWYFSTGYDPTGGEIDGSFDPEEYDGDDREEYDEEEW